MAVCKRIADISHTRPKPVRVFAPAKLNLGLRIVGRRADGYHLIQSLFWPLSFRDELRVEAGDGLRVEALWDPDAPRPFPPPPQGRENLVYRAAEQALGSRSGLSIRVVKRVPMGAGLGGGSANAGALLAHLTRAGLIESPHAEKTALALGADVPYFLTPVPAWVEGIGERRSPVRVAPEVLKGLSFLLILPPQATPTPIVFSRYRALGVPFAPSYAWTDSAPLDWDRLGAYLSEAENSLQGVAAMEYPLVSRILARLGRAKALYAGLSGTGSTCFAVFSSEAQAREMAKDLDVFCRKNGCQSIIARTHSEPAEEAW